MLELLSMLKAGSGLVSDIFVSTLTLLLHLTNNSDVLNRFPYQTKTSDRPKTDEPKPDLQTIHVMMYIFPRQFDLHNVFTSVVDSRETTQPFKDYTLREDEINKKYNPSNVKLPKRLRGKTVDLVQKLRIYHSRCSYKELLDYYCPVIFSILFSSSANCISDLE